MKDWLSNIATFWLHCLYVESENSNTKNVKLKKKKKKPKRSTFYLMKSELYNPGPNNVGSAGVKKTKWVCLNMISHSYAQPGN